MGQRSSTSTSPFSSICSPSRLKIRPRVAFPTGTVIGPPVSRTSVPRARPSVESIATARTRSSPRCCCTSQTSRRLLPATSESSEPSPVEPSASWRASMNTSSALLISGRLSAGNTASITTPWISSTRPRPFSPPPFCRSVPAFSSRPASVDSFFCSVLASTLSLSFRARGSWLAEPLGSGDDFHDLLRDLGLPLAVCLERQVLDQVGGIVGRVSHRGHARAVLGRGRLEQAPEDRNLDVVGDQPPEDLLGRLRLVDPEGAGVTILLLVLGAMCLTLLALGHERRHLLDGQERLVPNLLVERGDVVVVKGLDPVHLAVGVGGG